MKERFAQPFFELLDCTCDDLRRRAEAARRLAETVRLRRCGEDTDEFDLVVHGLPVFCPSMHLSAAERRCNYSLHGNSECPVWPFSSTSVLRIMHCMRLGATQLEIIMNASDTSKNSGHSR